MIRAACCILLALVLTLGATPPQVGGQAPGYFRFQLGEMEITALHDGSLALDVHSLLSGLPAAELAAELRAAHLPGKASTSVNAFLVHTGAHLVLVDTGTGGVFGPELGTVLDNLRASGYQPEDVDEILLTHLHGDHAGGLLLDGRPAFPNATVRVHQRELDHWLSDSARAAAPDRARGSFDNARRILEPLQAAGRIRPITGDGPLLPGISSRLAPGHTPGHCVFTVESGGRILELWGDLLHVAAVQFAHPEVVIAFDSDSPTAAATRQAELKRLAGLPVIVGGAHLDFPGLGRVRERCGAYEWLPLERDPLTE